MTNESDQQSDPKPSPSEQWLAARAPGFQHLPDLDRRAIYDFAFLWSLFEARLQGGFARSNTIRDMVDGWRDANTLDIAAHADDIAYFRQRYFANGELTGHYPYLNLRPGDHPAIVQSVLDGSSEAPRDQMLALLMIVWRLRNNLFHGAKWAYALQDQLDNFTHANAVLMRLLDQHGGLH
ncbi:hypothetical protein [Sphingomonas guangdongensis]|nr:hypothetical protein [Sphingomonas guangdongensis]